MSLKNEIIEERKKHLGLNETNTKMIYDKIMIKSLVITKKL